MAYRVFVVLGAGLLLAACTSSSSWLNLDALKPAPPTDTVRFETTPPGAEARTSAGQTCQTPCALTLPANAPFTVTFSLNGYLPESEQIELVSVDDGSTRLRPNPVTVLLAAAPPPPPVKKKPVRKRGTAKPKAAAKPAAPRAAAPRPAAPAAASPWPAPQPPR